ncbi:polysaccharide biosynthesis/export family protein [Consotaella aegiceratis]|uniref:polysaccharide biosynthesis/export family protein n=1 Tax=Consotaella aegiceratis TaxID=3097961 RepID=UPI002F415F55
MNRSAVALIVLLSLAGCASSYVPSGGPKAGAIRNTTLAPSGHPVPVVDLSVASYYMVPLPPEMDASAEERRHAPRGDLSRLGRAGYNATRLRPGDVIEVTIFDTGEEGLFASTASRSLALGRFTVDPSGFVTLPFVGRQRVVDSSPAALQDQIVNGLRGSAVNPQAVVNVVDKPGAVVTVDGAVRSPGRFPISGGVAVLDAIALAGGAQSKPEETTVTVERAGRRASAALDQVLASTSQNISLAPGDRIFLGAPGEEEAGEKASYTTYGAFKSAGEFSFEPGELTLDKAIGRAGGLRDDQADPLNVYLFRTQKVPAVATAASAGKSPGEPVPVALQPIIVRVNMKDPASFIQMQSFKMLDGDILYATNAKSVDWAKYLNVLKQPPQLPAAPAPGGSS